MHVPGHAPGHVAFIGEGVALSGDLLFAGSIGRTDLPLSDPYAMDVSLERFAALPVDTIVYPGHGPAHDDRTGTRDESVSLRPGARAQALRMRSMPALLRHRAASPCGLARRCSLPRSLHPRRLTSCRRAHSPARSWDASFQSCSGRARSSAPCLGGASRSRAAARFGGVVAIAACLVAQLVISPRIERIRVRHRRPDRRARPHGSATRGIRPPPWLECTGHGSRRRRPAAGAHFIHSLHARARPAHHAMSCVAARPHFLICN